MKLTKEKLEKIVIASTLSIFLIGFFYSRSILNEKEVKVEDKRQEEKIIEEKPSVVFVNINGVQHRILLKNTNTVLELLEKLREDGILTFEKIAYTYGTELDMVNGIKAPEGMAWKLYMSVPKDDAEDIISNLLLHEKEAKTFIEATTERQDITFVIGSMNLADKALFELELTQK